MKGSCSKITTNSLALYEGDLVARNFAIERQNPKKLVRKTSPQVVDGNCNNMLVGKFGIGNILKQAPTSYYNQYTKTSIIKTTNEYRHNEFPLKLIFPDDLSTILENESGVLDHFINSIYDLFYSGLVNDFKHSPQYEYTLKGEMVGTDNNQNLLIIEEIIREDYNQPENFFGLIEGSGGGGGECTIETMYNSVFDLDGVVAVDDNYYTSEKRNPLEAVKFFLKAYGVWNSGIETQYEYISHNITSPQVEIVSYDTDEEEESIIFAYIVQWI